MRSKIFCMARGIGIGDEVVMPATARRRVTEDRVSVAIPAKPLDARAEVTIGRSSPMQSTFRVPHMRPGLRHARS
ncbi:MAG: hypothetical protein EOR81_19480 [Mesorhizobium sp.]|nr:MAG: hypothetical protein EOR81_19480 [Mesorhizobium sp.]